MLLASLRPRVLPLTRYERRIRPVGGVAEEGLLEHLFSVLGPGGRFCIEIGAGDGTTHSLTRNLIEAHGWSALLIEGDPQRAARMQEAYRGHPRVRAVQAFVTMENVEQLLRDGGAPPVPDFLSIDIDGIDLWVWQAIQSVQPRVVCIEYNASFRPGQRFVVDYAPVFRWAGDDYQGAALENLVELGRRKGYALAHCTANGDNAIFVAPEALPALGVKDNSVAALYQIPQFGRCGRAPNGKGHPGSPRTSTAWQRIGWRLRYHAMALPRKLARALHRRLMRRLGSAAAGDATAGRLPAG
jgi:hypothetical protein